MADVTSYSQLLADAQRVTEDDSAEFLTEFPRLLARVQDRIQRDLNLRHFHLYTSTALTGSVNTLAVNSSWLRVDNIIMPDGVPLEEKSYAFLKMYGATEGRPRFYCRDTEATLLFAPTPDQSYSITVDALSRLAALTPGSPTNWLTTNCADLYLVGTLAESERFLKSIARAADYEAQYERTLMSVKAELGHMEATPHYHATAGTMMEAKDG